MSLELTREQLEAAGKGPVTVTDPETKEVYFVLRVDLYAQTCVDFHEDFDPREAYPLIDKIMAEDDANDPAFESYQRYRKQP